MFHARHSTLADPLDTRGSAGLLYGKPGHPSMTSALVKMSTSPAAVYRAEGLLDDFYTHLMAWSKSDAIAIALYDTVYSMLGNSDSVKIICKIPPASGHVTCITFGAQHSASFLGIGSKDGYVSIWDAEVGKCITQSLCSPANKKEVFVGAMDWNGTLLSVGYSGGAIWNHDMRQENTKVQEFLGHRLHAKISGLKWRDDGQLLASGGDDDTLCCWDTRMTMKPILRKARDFKAAIKALAWCSWKPSILAAGGGVRDPTLRLYSTTGSSLEAGRSVYLDSQITSVHFSSSCTEVLTTHGHSPGSSSPTIPRGSIKVHKFSSLEPIRIIEHAHCARITDSCMSPDGTCLLTGGDELVKIWNVWGKRRVALKDEHWQTIR